MSAGYYRHVDAPIGGLFFRHAGMHAYLTKEVRFRCCRWDQIDVCLTRRTLVSDRARFAICAASESTFHSSNSSCFTCFARRLSAVAALIFVLRKNEGAWHWRILGREVEFEIRPWKKE